MRPREKWTQILLSVREVCKEYFAPTEASPRRCQAHGSIMQIRRETTLDVEAFPAVSGNIQTKAGLHRQVYVTLGTQSEAREVPQLRETRNSMFPSGLIRRIKFPLEF